jgi:hypothetical protein
MYIPSYDFRIFDLPMFSPLQAQEFGADTMFSANTPTSFIDNSINQLSGLLDPRAAFPYIQRQFPSVVDRFGFDTYFQGIGQTRAEIEAEVERTKKLYDEAVTKAKTTPQCPSGYSPVSVFGIFSYCGKDLKSIDDAGIAKSKAGETLKPIETLFNNLPKGSGVFLIAVVIIILLLLFVKK